MLNEFTAKPIFGFTICVIAYHIGSKTKARFNYPIVNPLIVATLICIAVLTVFQIPLKNFMNGANMIAMFLAPATAALALTMYRQLKVIKKNLIPIIVGCTVGSGVAIASVMFLCKVFGLTPEVTASLIPKSITTAIASDLSLKLGGIPTITVAAVMVTGIFGTIISPYLIKWTHLNNSVAAGLAIGSSCHALGTTKAIEIGDVEGSLSGIAVGLCGLITVFFSLFVV